MKTTHALPDKWCTTNYTSLTHYCEDGVFREGVESGRLSQHLTLVAPWGGQRHVSEDHRAARALLQLREEKRGVRGLREEGS